MLLIRTTGVLPTVSSMEFLIPGIVLCLRFFRRSTWKRMKSNGASGSVPILFTVVNPG